MVCTNPVLFHRDSIFFFTFYQNENENVRFFVNEDKKKRIEITVSFYSDSGFLEGEKKKKEKKQIEITVSFFSAPAFPEGKKRKERKNEEKRKKAARGARRVLGFRF